MPLKTQIFAQIKADNPSGELMKLTFNGQGSAMGSIYIEESPPKSLTSSKG